MKPLFKVYYHLRSLIPEHVKIQLRRQLIHTQRLKNQTIWPINPKTAERRPPWSQWPDNKQFALVLTHDVELMDGVKKCELLMELEEEFGLRSSFNFVPERYTTPPELREKLKNHGFEVGVHGLRHDGRLYESERTFMKRAERINQYIQQWDAVGFRSPSMHHNLDWLHKLNIRYDASTFDTDPFEPDNTALGTIFPTWVPPARGKDGYVELPYTLPQDSTLFIYLQEPDIRIWKEKLDWVAQHNGMALINVHPDYMNFSSGPLGRREYPADHYRRLLEYIHSNYRGKYWNALPCEIAEFARAHLTAAGDRQQSAPAAPAGNAAPDIWPSSSGSHPTVSFA